VPHTSISAANVVCRTALPWLIAVSSVAALALLEEHIPPVAGYLPGVPFAVVLLLLALWLPARPMIVAIVASQVALVVVARHEADAGFAVARLIANAVIDCIVVLLALKARRAISESGRRRVVEQETLTAMRAAQAANRLKDEFISNMSHELRTPLNGIIGFSELLYDGRLGPLAADHREYVGHILNSSRHLLRIIGDVLDLAQVESGRMVFSPETVDLYKLANEVCDILSPASAKKRLQVSIAVDPELGDVAIDSGRFKQVLYNYLSNAIKFTPDGGRISVRMHAEGDHLFRVDVADTGIGVRTEDLSRLFLEFHQLDSGTSKLYPGTGLGLALTKRIVEAQGGSVALHSTLNEGSVFSATIPRHAARAGLAV
jgi:signal transduction histidine kinase